MVAFQIKFVLTETFVVLFNGKVNVVQSGNGRLENVVKLSSAQPMAFPRLL